MVPLLTMVFQRRAMKLTRASQPRTNALRAVLVTRKLVFVHLKQLGEPKEEHARAEENKAQLVDH